MSDLVFRAIDSRLELPTPVRAEFSAYVNGERPAIRLVVDDPHGKFEPDGVYDGEPWLVATVNLPDCELPPGSVAIKNWGENEGIEQVLRDAGLIEGQSLMNVAQGHVSIPVYQLTAAAQTAIDETLGAAVSAKKSSLIRPL